MSSHREAPEISKDPVADSTDLYAFVNPQRPHMVVLIANYLPLQGPDGGPNFYEFGEDVLYEINIDNDNDAVADITYQFRFSNKLRNPDTFLYNTGPIASLDSPNWNRRQTYTVTEVIEGQSQVIGSDLACPPCHIGPLSTPDYASLAHAAVHDLGGRIRVFAGQRAEGFYVDLGAIFDLGILRPFEQLHTTFGLHPGLGKPAPGVNATKALNVHSIAIEVPKAHLVAGGKVPGKVSDPYATIGVWTTASRQQAHVGATSGRARVSVGPWTQVSRLGNPLINEVVIPMGKKDLWNTLPPSADSQFASYVQFPELAQLLPVLYPNVFPNLAAFNASGQARADLDAILMTGIPNGVVPGFQNYTGPTQADMLRLNVVIPPTTTSPSNLGLIGGDPAGFPNGRRVFDDVVTIEIRAVAGATLPLVDPSYTADGAAGVVTDGLTSGPSDLTAMGTENYLSDFPFLGVPLSGFDTPAA